MDGKDLLFVCFWIGALLCTMIVWMYWPYVYVTLYTFAITLILLNIGELFYHGSEGTAK